MPSVPMTVTACVLESGDAEGIRREMRAVAADGLRVALRAEQVGVVLEAWRDLERALDEARAFDRG
jgi:hypothetical protein